MNKCPVCDSKVDHLNPLFQVEHLKQKYRTSKSKLKILKKKKINCQNEKNSISRKLEKAIKAESTLKAHSIKNLEDELDKIKQEILKQKTIYKKFPLL